ncbi:MAG: CvpA family protein [Acidimicrobiia bacterium]|nr:CvpA family protein [Acidimicrobiia bacterium]
MLDFVLGICLSGLAIRGWMRGLVKELLDLAALVIGAVVAFRMSGPLGDFLADRFDVTPEWARIGAGITLFVLIGVGATVLAYSVGRVMRAIGLNLPNRLLGAAFGLAWGVVLIVIVATILLALPLPVEDTLAESEVVTALAGPEALPRQAFQKLAGDDVLDTLLALGSKLGQSRVVLDEDDVVAIDPAEPDQLVGEPKASAELLALTNRERLAVDENPLAWSDILAAVARRHAEEMYLEGYVSHVSPTTGIVVDRVRAAGVNLFVVGENLALASNARAVHDGFMDSPGHRENLLRPEFDRIGIASVRGPLGLMVVQVFGG